MAAPTAQKQSPVTVGPQAALCWRCVSLVVRTAEGPGQPILLATPLSLRGNPRGNPRGSLPVELAVLFKTEAGTLDRCLSWV